LCSPEKFQDLDFTQTDHICLASQDRRRPAVPRPQQGSAAVEFKDYYQILGVVRGAGADEIKKAFRKLAEQKGS